MADQLQLRRGTTSEILLFTGAQGEVIYDTDKNTLVGQDGITAGGFPLASEQSVSDGTFYFNDDTAGGSAANAYILEPKANTNTPTNYLDGIQLGFTTANANTGPSTANFQGLGVKNLKYRDGTDPAAGDISGRVYLIFDAANDWLEIQRKATGPQPQIRTISGTVASNALTLKLIAPAIVDFRSTTLGSGTINSRSVTSDLTLVVPAGATLGTVNGQASRVVLVAIDNAGTPELAVINSQGGQSFDETTLISTTAISAGSSSASTYYSTAARSGVPFRVLGFVDSTQTIAGTWAATPSEVQGQGGQNIIGASRLVSAQQLSTSGTSIDFTGIPSWAKRITLSLAGVSTNGTANMLVQIGDSGGVETSGYASTSSLLDSATSVTASTAGFALRNATAAAVVHGQITLTNVGGDLWSAAGVFSNSGVNGTMVCAGSKTLTAILDRVRLTTSTGADTFDAGSVGVIYEG